MLWRDESPPERGKPMRTVRGTERRKAGPAENGAAVRPPDVPAVRVPVSACTFAGFRAWCVSDEFPEQGEIFYLDGEIYIDTSPERLNSHRTSLRPDFGREKGSRARKGIECRRDILSCDSRPLSPTVRRPLTPVCGNQGKFGEAATQVVCQSSVATLINLPWLPAQIGQVAPWGFKAP
jgi:hypothetical protein